MDRITLIGFGNMGKALYLAMDPASTEIFDRDEPKIDSDVVLLSIKPDVFRGFPHTAEGKLVISVMAGVTLEEISQKMKTERVVRAMPNLPVSAGEGVTGWIASEACKEADLELVRDLFGKMGVEVEVESEDALNRLTSISGSGPAYFYYFCELMEEKAKELGFSEEEARRLANQTMIGAAALLNGRSAKELRESVAAKGGTTEKAIEALKIKQQVSNAVDAAYTRAKELS